MLPFLSKIKKESGIANIIIKNRTSDEKTEENQEDKEYSLENYAKDIISAVHSNDSSKLANTLKEVFQKLDSAPHIEGKHVTPHSYDAQNIKAGEK